MTTSTDALTLPVASVRPAAASRRGRVAALAALPLLLFLLLFFAGPIAGLLGNGFKGEDGGLTLAHYRHLLDTPIYRIVLVNTFTIAAAVTVACVVLSYPLAYLMATVSPTVARVVFFAVLLPFWSSALVRTYMGCGLPSREAPSFCDSSSTT